ncbi:hypothetical protein PUR61_31250, partial [Streptomyces sp. BE20]|nr:hypothetical protein [Streptomyces sp. BE20]
MPTARFCRLIGVPERTWRRHRARARRGAQAKGPWPRPAREGVRDAARRHELGWHVAPTANQHDAIAAIELALAEAERLAGAQLVDLARRATDGTVQPLVTIVTDNGGPFRSFRFEA